MKKADFLALVLSSVLFLKEKATKEEIESLTDTISYPGHKERCILGQMTGQYDTPRAKEISQKIITCDENKRLELRKNNIDYMEGSGMFGTSPCYNEHFLETITTETVGSQDKFAAFEVFILMNKANTNELIEFLKGKRETFEPTFG